MRMAYPCVEYVGMAVIASYFVVLLLHNVVRAVWKKNGEDEERSSSGDFGVKVSCRGSIASSAVLLGIHVVDLVTVRKRGFSFTEAAEVVLWIVSLAGACWTLITRRFRYPWMLRWWWLCSFILSTIQVYKMRRYVDFAGVLFSALLVWISVRGTTGAVLRSSESIRDPLLKGHGGKESLYGRAKLLQLISFSWMNPLFAIGAKNPLEQTDIPEVADTDSAKSIASSFDDALREACRRREEGTSVYYNAIYRLIRRKAAINAVFAVINASVSYVGPYLIDAFVSFLTEKKSRKMKEGYVLAVVFLGAKMVETIAQRQWIFGARQLGMRLRAALISRIYSKGLVLSSQSRQSQTSGEMINVMSVDVQRVSDLVWYLNTIWMLPIQISLAMLILRANLGVGSCAALAATAAVMACNIPLTQWQKKYQAKIMAAKDSRMKSTTEVLRNMKTIKLQAWDSQFLKKIKGLRDLERRWLWKSLRLGAFSAFMFWGSPALISVVTFLSCMVIGIPLTAGRVLSALATFRMLQDPIFNLPELLSVIAQGKVSAYRIASYLEEEEIQHDAIDLLPREETDMAVEIRAGEFSWNPEALKTNLEIAELRIKKGMKVAICGTVGSGKSTMISAMIGEIYKLSGTVKVAGTKAYVSQTPWIVTGNIKDNILFGNPYDVRKYSKTVEACALAQDLELFSSGDLLDDPFSAVDAHTGTHLFKECLMGVLKEKTVIYVTHQVEFLPAADLIVVMHNGRISQAGRFEEILQQNTGFEALVGAHTEALEAVSPAAVEYSKPVVHKYQNVPEEVKRKQGKLVQEEERRKGSIGREVYWAYLTAFKGGALLPIILVAQASFQGIQIASNYWMAWTSPPTRDSKPVLPMSTVLYVYALLSLGSSLCVLVRTTLVAIAGLSTAEKLFDNMLQSIMRAPMAFFDSTPSGRILNRASNDQSVVDLELANRVGWCAFSIIQLLGTIVVMSQAAWQVFVIFIPVTVICVWYQRYYIPTARELARLSEIQRAPILHHFAESLAGASIIRAFDREDRFTEANLQLIDRHSRPWFHNVAAMEWLSFRLNLLSNFVFASSLVVLVSLPEGIISPSGAGLAVTYGISLNVLQASVIWNMCNAENKMVAVERLLQYSNLISEAPLVIEECRPPISWPESGTISFRNLLIGYGQHLVLKNIDCTFPGRTKVGVVGRTGSGKSTLIQALFRIVEPRSGSITIDGIDISRIGLHDLRSRLSIIPQDPSLFEGTVRENLDPLGQFTDNEIWEALDKCQLGDLVRSKEGRLDSAVAENGENWSCGQRQLFCLGRALLKKSKILVLDEATASVDFATDGMIQNTLRNEFQHQTVLTIAHRIHTVIDSDLVLVLDDGRVAEFDSPGKLLAATNSYFSSLVAEYYSRSQNNQSRFE